MAMRNSGFQPCGERIATGLFWLLFALLIVLPLLWVFLVSLQAAGVASGDRYSLFPRQISIQAFELAIFENYRGIRSSLGYSLFVGIVATVTAMVVALSAAYLVNARVRPLKCRRKIVLGAISLFFLPAFAIYPGVEALADCLPFFRSTVVQLMVIHSIQAFAIAFVLLLALFASLSSLDFEQLLLETGSRVRAFWWGVVARNIAGVTAVATLTFATVWSEFYLTSFVTTRDQDKPFSVVLQMFEGQYRTDYASLAAGAVVSLIVSLGPVAVLLLYGAARRGRDRIGRERDRG